PRLSTLVPDFDAHPSCTSSFFCFFFLLLPRPPISTLFPYTTLFRSERRHSHWQAAARERPRRARRRRRWRNLVRRRARRGRSRADRKSTRLNSSHVEISYAVFCLKKKKKKQKSDSMKVSSECTNINS